MIKEDKKATLLLLYDERMQEKKNMWYLYDITSNHMYREKDKFTKFDEAIKDNVTFIDHSKVAIQ